MKLLVVLTAILAVSYGRYASKSTNEQILQRAELQALLQRLKQQQLDSELEWIAKGWNPSKRCAMLGDEACANGALPGAGADSDFLSGGFNPGKRCAMLGDEGCANGGVPGAGQDLDFLNGGFNPGK